MKKEYKNSILLILIILLCILGIIFYYRTIEGFQEDTTPQVINSRIRIDNTCSDPKQTNVFDRFTFVQPIGKDDDGNDTDCSMYTNYTIYNGFPFDTNNVCLPICDPEKGWHEYLPDRTYCVRSNCMNTVDLSGQIKTSWTHVCGPIAKQHYTLTSTLASISTVSQTFNTQFNQVNSNYSGLFTTLQSYNCANPANSANCLVRNTRLPAITDNYMTLNNLKNSINVNFIDLSNKMRPFNIVHRAFGCDLFI